MKGILLSTPQDYFALVDRRRWWVISISCVLSLVALLVAVSLPSIYVSETLILVQPQEVPQSVVQDFVAWDTQQRLISLQEQILSRSMMLQILEAFPEGFDELRPLGEEEQVEVLRSRIDIEVAGAGQRGRREAFVPFFRISYQDRDPDVAQKVTDRLATLFISEDDQTRERQVVNTAEFLDREVEKVSEELKTAEDELAALKLRYGNELPEHLDTNLRTLDRLQQQLAANAEQRDRYLTFKMDLQRQLSETEPTIEREIFGSGAASRVNRAPSPQVTAYRDKQLLLQQLLARYTEAHPTVQQLRAEMEKLAEDIPPEDLLEIQDPLPVEATVEKEPNPVYQQINSQLLRVNNELEIAESRRQSIEADIQQINRRVMATPGIEQQVLVVQRRYDSLKAEFDRLKGRQGEADLARSMQTSQKGEQFTIMDRANYPYSPSKPNRWLVLAVGFGIALAISLVVAVAVDIADQRIYTYAEVEQLLGAPVLAEIPRIAGDVEQQAARRRGWMKVAAMLGVVGVGLAAVYTIYTVPELRSEGAEFMARLLKW